MKMADMSAKQTKERDKDSECITSARAKSTEGNGETTRWWAKEPTYS